MRTCLTQALCNLPGVPADASKPSASVIDFRSRRLACGFSARTGYQLCASPLSLLLWAQSHITALLKAGAQSETLSAA